METQKILNLLSGSDNDNSKFAKKKGTILVVNLMLIIHKMVK